MNKHILTLDVPDTYNPKILRIDDTSQYSDSISVDCSSLFITPPGFIYPVEIPVIANFRGSYTACNLGIQLSNCTDFQGDIPDGIYIINYSVSPKNKVYVEYEHLRITSIMNRYFYLLTQLELSNSAPSADVKEDLNSLNLIRNYIDAAKAFVEYSHDTDKGMELLLYADKLMKRLYATTCYVQNPIKFFVSQSTCNTQFPCPTPPSTGTGCVPPVITSQPTGGSYTSGGSISLSVTATSVDTPTYQWLKNGIAISGATGSIYTINDSQTSDSANYSVTITNGCCSVISNAATLSVTNPVVTYTASWGWTDTNPTLSLPTSLTGLTLQGGGTVTAGSALIADFRTGSGQNRFFVLKVPNSYATFTHWYNTALNNGDIPDTVWNDVIVIGSFSYYVTRALTGLDPSSLTTFS